MPEFQQLFKAALRRPGGDREMAEILALKAAHEQVVPYGRAGPEADAATKTTYSMSCTA
jgi:hypothetical protein